MTMSAKSLFRNIVIISLCSTTLLFLISARSPVSQADPAALELKIAQGIIAGTVSQAVAVFKGIPYAQAPIDDLRWRAPRPARPWTGVFSAKDYGPYCMQSKAPFPMPKDFRMSEDCLTLNVWAPTVNMNTAKAVVVWIHGGGFAWNSGALPRLDGTALAQQGLIVVTFNYRLGAFGAFAHPDISARQPDEPLGNYNLMDWLAALRWVQKNISIFGGDPDNVTIFGESAGGIAVNHLMVTPAAKGLFHKAISQSGPLMLSGDDKLFLRETDGGEKSLEAFGSRVAAQLGATKHIDVPSALRAISAEEIAELSVSMRTGWPVIDGNFITDSPPLLFDRGLNHEVPYMAGNNSWEGILMKAIPDGDELYKRVDKDILTDTYGDIDNEELSRMFFEDATFFAPIRYVTQRVSSTSNPAYLYHFSYVARVLRPFLQGAPHASEINYVFKTLPAAIVEHPIPEFFIADQDYEVSDLMSAYWVQFAKTGNPNGQGRPQWDRCNKQRCPTLDIGTTTTLHPDLFSKRAALHQSLLTQRLKTLSSKGHTKFGNKRPSE